MARWDVVTFLPSILVGRGTRGTGSFCRSSGNPVLNLRRQCPGCPVPGPRPQQGHGHLLAAEGLVAGAEGRSRVCVGAPYSPRCATAHGHHFQLSGCCQDPSLDFTSHTEEGARSAAGREISFSCCLSTRVCFGPRGPAPLPPGLWGSGSAGSRDQGLGEAGGNHPGHKGTCRAVSVSSCRPAMHARCWSHSCGRQASDPGQVGATAVLSFPVLGSVGIAPSSHPF